LDSTGLQKWRSLLSDSCTMAQAVRFRPLVVGAWVQFQTSPCGICGGQSGTETDLSPSTLVFPFQHIPPMLHTHSFTYHGCYIILAVDRHYITHSLLSVICTEDHVSSEHKRINRKHSRSVMQYVNTDLQGVSNKPRCHKLLL
jgi:hypothetical protein